VITAVLAMIATMFVGLGGAARVSAGTDDYPSQWRSAAPDSLVDTWSEYNRECTSFVAFRLSSRNGFTMPFHDNATGWGADAQSRGYTVNMTPALGAVAWWSAGHVAWVEAIDGGSVTIEEYNFNFTHNYSERVIAASSVSGYIHFKDLATTPPPPPPSGVDLGSAVYMGGDHLGIGQSMSANRYLTSNDGRYVLLMQNDGNLVEYGPGLVPLWWSSTAGMGGAYVVMQADGNFVMYKSDGVTPVWATWTDGLNGSYVAVQNDGNLVAYQSNGVTAVWQSGKTGDMFTAMSTGTDRLTVGQSQLANQYLQSSDGRYRLLLIGDGNWVLYGPGYHVLWANWQMGSNGAYIVLQSDSNLVEYLANHATAVWATWTGGSGGAYVVVQNDGNVVMYQANGATAVWNTGTAGRI
jgi:surface antigen